jgi:hypothetical protein
MEAKFVKCENLIVNANDILLIRTHESRLIIECTNKTHVIYFSSCREAKDELNRIYNILK